VPAGDAILGHVVTFGRVLHEAGLEVGPGRVADALRALDAVDLARQEDVYFSLRQTLVSRHDELDLFDRAFSAWFLRAPVLPPVRSRSSAEVETRVGQAVDRLRTRETEEEEADPGDPLELGASGHELLRDKDFAELTGDELRRLRELIARIGRSRPQRHSRRRTPDARGDRLDVRRMIRRSLRAGGDPLDRPLRTRKDVPRKLVVLCDVSGSMDSYARALLLFLHAVVGTGRGVEAFAFGTRLSRLTPTSRRAIRMRRSRAVPRRSSTGGAGRGSGRRSASSTRSTAGAHCPAGRSSSSSPTAGSARTRSSSGARWRSLRARPTRSSGSTR